MRWMRSKTYLKDRVDEKRIIKRFLYWPKWLPNSKNKDEWRWLEKAKILQKVCPVDVGGSGIFR